MGGHPTKKRKGLEGLGRKQINKNNGFAKGDPSQNLIGGLGPFLNINPFPTLTRFTQANAGSMFWSLAIWPNRNTSDPFGARCSHSFSPHSSQNNHKTHHLKTCHIS